MRWKRTIVALALCAVCAGQQASALEYTIDAPADYLFGRASSVETVYRETEPINTDRSKNVSLIPPTFGSPTSYLPGSGEYLTPNLVPGALSGGLVSSLTGASYTNNVSYGTGSAYYGTGTVTGSGGAVQYPSVDGVSYSGGVSYGTGDSGTVQYPGVDTVTWTYELYTDNTGFYGVSFTDVTDDLYYSGGHLGTLKIPSIGVNVKIYEGTGKGRGTLHGYQHLGRQRFAGRTQPGSPRHLRQNPHAGNRRHDDPDHEAGNPNLQRHQREEGIRNGQQRHAGNVGKLRDALHLRTGPERVQVVCPCGGNVR